MATMAPPIPIPIPGHLLTSCRTSSIGILATCSYARLRMSSMSSCGVMNRLAIALLHPNHQHDHKEDGERDLRLVGVH